MRTTLHYKEIVVHFHRNSFTGHFTYTYDGVTKVIQHAIDPRTHIWFTLSKTYPLKIGEHMITLLHKRPLLMSAFKPHLYEFYAEDNLIHTVEA